jgi:hypothetical protein
MSANEFNRSERTDVVGKLEHGKSKLDELCCLSGFCGILVHAWSGSEARMRSPAKEGLVAKHQETSSEAIDPHELIGVWRSRSVYPSSGRAGEFVGEHVVEFRLIDGRLHGHGIADESDSQLSIELVIEGPIATGMWRERTSPTGYYRGRMYHGALQLAISDNSHRMTGKWLGYGGDLSINSGEWELLREITPTSRETP